MSGRTGTPRRTRKKLPADCCGHCARFLMEEGTGSIYGQCRDTRMGTRYDWLKTRPRDFRCGGLYYAPRGGVAVNGE